LFAPNFCQEIGIQYLMLEGDALTIVQALSNDKANGTRFGHLVEDTRRVLKTKGWQCTFVSRTGNEAAHSLALLAKQHIIQFKKKKKKQHIIN
jgi:hypothetical protein